jgi:hypothetical protein
MDILETTSDDNVTRIASGRQPDLKRFITARRHVTTRAVREIRVVVRSTSRCADLSSRAHNCFGEEALVRAGPAADSPALLRCHRVRPSRGASYQRVKGAVSGREADRLQPAVRSLRSRARTCWSWWGGGSRGRPWRPRHSSRAARASWRQSGAPSPSPSPHRLRSAPCRQTAPLAPSPGFLLAGCAWSLTRSRCSQRWSDSTQRSAWACQPSAPEASWRALISLVWAWTSRALGRTFGARAGRARRVPDGASRPRRAAGQGAPGCRGECDQSTW